MSSLPVPTDHLDDDSVLLLTTGELDSQTAERAEKHLQLCQACREKLDSASSLRLHLRQAFEQQTTSQCKQHLNRRRAGWPRWIAAAAAIVAILSWTTLPRRLEAKEVLNRALLAETRNSSPSRRVQIRTEGVSCSINALQLAQASTMCARINIRVHLVQWDWQHPLSAEAFRAWHDGLQAKADSVQQTEDAVVLTTEPRSNLVRSASLTLKASDYRVTRIFLTLTNLPSIEISEVDANSGSASTEVANRADIPTQNKPVIPVEELDAEEVNAWLLLDRLDLLDAWKATVRRNSESVYVTAALEADERQQLLKSLGTLRLTEMHRFAPVRASFSESPSLGGSWIRKTLPAGTNVTVLTNEVLVVSQHILGQASVREQLRGRRGALRSCACSTRLSPLIEKQQERLMSSTTQLIALLQPLLGAPVNTPPLLTSAEAHRLDTALIHVFASGPPGPQTLDDELGQIETLLRLPRRPL